MDRRAFLAGVGALGGGLVSQQAYSQLPMFLAPGGRGKKHVVAGSGYPDASNTGVPAGTSLSTNTGDYTTSSNGEIVDALNITGTLVIQHNNVRAKRCAVFDGIYVHPDVTGGVIVEDCTVDGGLRSMTAVTAHHCTVQRCNIFGAENGFDGGAQCTIVDNFVHDLYNDAVTHSDGIQVATYADSGFTMRHNTIISNGIPEPDTTSCVIGDVEQHDWLVTDNVFAGGNWTVYGPGTGSTNATLSNNKFWTLYYGSDKSGATGSLTSTANCTVTGNQLGHFASYDSTNKLIIGSWTQTGTVDA